MMNHQYDLAIIGAGPAGTAAAIYAAQKGLNVILLESAKTVRSRPGESLPPGAETLFRQLGMWSRLCEFNLLRYNGHYTYSEINKEKKFHAYGHDANGSWQGMQIPRAKLDEIAQIQAQTLGVTFYSGCHIKKIIFEKDKLSLLSANNMMIQAHYYIDATGHNQLFARQLNIPIVKHSQQLIAKYGYFSHACPHTQLPIYIQDKNGWYWYAEVANQLYAWVQVSHNKAFSSIEHNALGGADVTWRVASHTAGLQYFMVGDAACVLDPSAGHGVLRAMMTGMMAANTIYHLLKHQMTEDHAYRQYHRWLYDWYMKDVMELHKRFFLQENNHEARYF